MTKRVSTIVCLLVASLSWSGKVLAQAPSPEALMAAKEFIVASKMADQINNMLPHIMQTLKPLVTKGNPLAERDFDALMPTMMNVMNTHLETYLEMVAPIYARHFSADEIRQVTNFYRSPTGQKFLQKQPQLLQETFALGNKFGEALAKDLQGRITEELRKRGHNI
jgi:uncharacterized protein